MLSSSIFIIFSLFLTFEYHSNEINFMASRTDFWDNDKKKVETAIIVLWVFTATTFILAILDSNLVFFHFWLIKHKFTTYEYILRRREKDGQKIDVFFF